MTSWSDWKDREKLEAALRSLVATNLRDKEIFGLACRHFPDYKWSLWTLDCGFWYMKFFVLTNRPCVWSCSYWSWWPRKFTRIRSVKYKSIQRGLKKGRLMWKNKWKINLLFLMSRYNWFHHTDMINLFYQNLTFQLGVNSCLDMFSRKNILHGLLFPFRI